MDSHCGSTGDRSSACVPQFAAAQGSYPSKPVTIIVQSSPGGTTDLAARMLAEPLGKALVQPIVVENLALFAPAAQTDHRPVGFPRLPTTGFGRVATFTRRTLRDPMRKFAQLL